MYLIKLSKRGKMKKEKLVIIDPDAHTDLKVLAAKRKISIKQFLKELVEEAKKQENQTLDGKRTSH